MKTSISLLLCSAAAIASLAGAQAADLPSRKAAPVNYVKICDAYGAGFFFIPGTETCLKIGGRVRAEYVYNTAKNLIGVNANQFAAAGAALSTVRPSIQAVSGAQDTSGFHARGRVDLDARTPTALGTVRTYISLRAANNSGLYNTNSNGLFSSPASSTAISIENAYIQWAGFTFGRAPENFNYFNSFAGYYTQHSVSDFSTGINQLAYTATFGGGFSATLAIEDRGGMGYANAPNGMMSQVTPVGAPAGALVPAAAIARVANGPLTWPALAGNIRVDQSWGSAVLSGVVVQNTAAVTGSLVSNAAVGSVTPFNGTVLATPTVDPLNNTLGGAAITKTGWAIGAGAKINLPMLAAGDFLGLSAAYTDGALDMVAVQSRGLRDFGGLIRQDRNMTVVPTSICAPAGGNGNAVCSAKAESTKSWSVAAALVHYWTPQLRQNFIASYQDITPGTVTRNTDWQFGGLSKANITILSTALIYSPAKDFDIGLEVAYGRLSQSLASFPGLAPSTTGGGTGAGLVAFSPSSTMFQTRLRVQRTF